MTNQSKNSTGLTYLRFKSNEGVPPLGICHYSKV